jgi:acetyl esterase
MSKRNTSFISLALAAGAMLLLAGCTPSDPEPAPVDDERTSIITTQNDLTYSTVDGVDLQLNACLPEKSADPTAAVILVHGGGFSEGDKDSGGMNTLCGVMAEQGFAAFNIDYRLAPSAYPAQTEDLTAVVEWLRADEQATRFGIDPARIGIFGSSAGAIMAASVGTAGSGDLTTGSRVAAVVTLSAAVDLTEAGIALGTPTPEAVATILSYLGCDAIENCPDAKDASALYSVDPTDPPFYSAISDAEFVPVGQAEAMDAALKAAGVPSTLDIHPGNKHGISLLDTATRTGILDFLAEALS